MRLPNRRIRIVRTLVIEIDTSTIMPQGTPLPSFVNALWMTAKTIASNETQIGKIQPYDGIGPQGNNFFQVPLGVTGTYTSDIGTTPLQPINSIFSTINPNINITNWTISVLIAMIILIRAGAGLSCHSCPNARLFTGIATHRMRFLNG